MPGDTVMYDTVLQGSRFITTEENHRKQWKGIKWLLTNLGWISEIGVLSVFFSQTQSSETRRYNNG